MLGGIWGVYGLATIRTSLYRLDGGINWGAALLWLPGTITQFIVSPLARVPSLYSILAIVVSVIMGVAAGLVVDVALDKLFKPKSAK